MEFDYTFHWLATAIAKSQTNPIAERCPEFSPSCRDECAFTRTFSSRFECMPEQKIRKLQTGGSNFGANDPFGTNFDSSMCLRRFSDRCLCRATI